MVGSLPGALLLDLDDTIIDDTGGADSCWHAVGAEAVGRVGIEVDTLVTAIMQVRDWYWSDPARHRVGRLDLRAATRHIVEQALGGLGLDPAHARAIAEEYRDRRDALLAPLPGALEALATFRRQGIRLALITNGAERPQRAKIERFGLASYFECIVVEEAFGVGKPDERVYRHALSELRAPPQDAWMVGDNLEWDVAAPKRLGLKGVWIDVKQRGLPLGCSTQPDLVIAALRELLE